MSRMPFDPIVNTEKARHSTSRHREEEENGQLINLCRAAFCFRDTSVLGQFRLAFLLKAQIAPEEPFFARIS
jgi:hypothetical protein